MRTFDIGGALTREELAWELVEVFEELPVVNEFHLVGISIPHANRCDVFDHRASSLACPSAHFGEFLNALLHQLVRFHFCQVL